jgi:hypothetical protein
MPNPGGFGELGFEQAALRIETVLRTRIQAPWRRLTRDELVAAYLNRRFSRGWRIEMAFSDGEVRSIDLLIGPNFPSGYPRTALVDGPGQLVWPHVEHDGILCLLPVMAEVDAEQPGEVAIQLLARSALLIEELIEGAIIDRDFREEFLTYWAYAADGRAEVHSLIEPRGPSRQICVWRDDKNMVVVGEDKPSLERWLAHRFGKLPGRKSRVIEPAALLWLSEPPLPASYPANGANLFELAEGAGEGAFELLVDVAGSLPKDVTVLIGAEGRGGPGLVAATTTAQRKTQARHGRVEAPLTKGFQPTVMPKQIAALRTYSAAAVEKSNVRRADARWIHGRGKDPRTPILLGKIATVIGCGSIGSSLVTKLVRAGVGTIHIVDYDVFNWSNLGRHELGASSIGRNKALELATRLQADFPHLTIVGHDVSAQALISGYGDLLAQSDLVIAATGSWDAEGALNRWHFFKGRLVPILYGWTESFAAAGHAVVIAREGGCLRCGIGPTGVPAFTATSWDAGGATIEEPSCGNHFTPYGAVELGFVVDLIADTALRTLLNPPDQSEHVIWLAPHSRVAEAGGQWSAALQTEYSDALEGGRRLARAWPASGCRACGGQRPATAA